jgi:flagellin FlaB
MFENESEENERGQVGIGTLIVFIAMVLVAAIAAGVLVNTAGFLQNTAEQSGEESVQQVTNRLQVVSQYGEVSNAGSEKGVGNVKLTVRKAAGSDDIDLDDTTINYLSDQGVVTLERDGTTANAAFYTSSAVRDEDGTHPVITDKGDRIELTINAKAIEDAASGTTSGLEPGEELKLEISTKTGETTTIRITIPDTLSGKSAGEPVSL